AISGASRWLAAPASGTRPGATRLSAITTAAMRRSVRRTRKGFMGALRFATRVRWRLLVDDVRLHAAERGQELVLLLHADLELVQALHEVGDERVELGVVDAHARVRGFHAAPGVLARAAARLADLIHQHRLQARNVGAGEPLVDQG